MNSNIVICRFCAGFYEKHKIFHNLFSMHKVSGTEIVNDIWNEINAWQLSVFPNDGLPEDICTDCYDKFLFICNFRNSCQKAQKQLKSLFIVNNAKCSLTTENPIENTESFHEYIIEETSIKTEGDAEALVEQQESSSLKDFLEATDEINAYDSRLGESPEDMSSCNVSLENDIKKSRFTPTNESDSKDYVHFGQEAPLKQTSDKGNSYVCQYCYNSASKSNSNGIFETYEALSAHLFEAHDPCMPYRCPHCSEQFKTAFRRNVHVQKTHGSNGAKCRYCNKISRGPLEIHENTCGQIGNWKCEFCGEKFAKVPLYQFRMHRDTHNAEENLQCKFCARKFSNSDQLKKHIHRYHENQKEPWTITCDICELLFASQTELSLHQQKEHGITKFLKCPFCERTYMSKCYLDKHIANFHPDGVGENPFKCNNCDATFDSVYKLRFHKQRQRDSNGRCLDTTASGTEKLGPKRLLETNKFLCGLCYERCTSAEEVRQHMITIHRKNAMYKCENCPKRFLSKRDLLQHTVCHAEKTFGCSFGDCEYIGKTRTGLSNHVRRRHQKTSCEYCGEKFTLKEMKSHLLNVHHAEFDMEVGAEELHPQVDLSSDNSSSFHVQYVDNIPLPLSNKSAFNNSSTLSSIQAEQEHMVNNLSLIMNEMRKNTNHIHGDPLLDPESEIIVT